VTRAAPRVDFFYGVGSRYSYLASTRLAGLAAETGCRVRWRPLFSGDLFAARGADPFAGRPVSRQYEWDYRRRDAERWAACYGVPYREPDDVRFDPRRLALACTAAAALGVAEVFSARLFQSLFVEGASPLDDAACARLAGEVGLDGGALRTVLEQPGTAARLAETTQDALQFGVFGVPSFVVGDEVFFGNDRVPLVRHHLLAQRHGSN
jgi:2-hydroxychromene-2-carboxylate isomerase